MRFASLPLVFVREKKPGSVLTKRFERKDSLPSLTLTTQTWQYDVFISLTLYRTTTFNMLLNKAWRGLINRSSRHPFQLWNIGVWKYVIYVLSETILMSLRAVLLSFFLVSWTTVIQLHAAEKLLKQNGAVCARTGHKTIQKLTKWCTKLCTLVDKQISPLSQKRLLLDTIYRCMKQRDPSWAPHELP